MPPPDSRHQKLLPPVKSVFSGSMSGLSASQSGQHSPTNSQISVATSIMSADCKVIFDERLRQVQAAVAKLRQMPLPRIEPCKEFENLVTMIKVLNVTQSNAMPSADDSKSLRLWAKVVTATPLHSILEADGYELVKTLIEKLW